MQLRQVMAKQHVIFHLNIFNELMTTTEALRQDDITKKSRNEAILKSIHHYRWYTDFDNHWDEKSVDFNFMIFGVWGYTYSIRFSVSALFLILLEMNCQKN